MRSVRPDEVISMTGNGEGPGQWSPQRFMNKNYTETWHCMVLQKNSKYYCYSFSQWEMGLLNFSRPGIIGFSVWKCNCSRLLAAVFFLISGHGMMTAVSENSELRSGLRPTYYLCGAWHECFFRTRKHRPTLFAIRTWHSSVHVHKNNSSFRYLRDYPIYNSCTNKLVRWQHTNKKITVEAGLCNNFANCQHNNRMLFSTLYLLSSRWKK